MDEVVVVDVVLFYEVVNWCVVGEVMFDFLICCVVVSIEMNDFDFVFVVDVCYGGGVWIHEGVIVIDDKRYGVGFSDFMYDVVYWFD